MKVVTFFGATPVYILLLPLIFWCFDEKKGVRLGIALMISTLINMTLKFALAQPRPFWEGWDPAVALIPEQLNGFPSGHAQNSLVMWIIVASWGRGKWRYGLAVLASALIGFSRIYLGVHFPTDIFGGWILGALVLTAYFLLGKRIEDALVRGGPRPQRIAAAITGFIMILYRPQAEILLPGAALLSMGLGYSFTAEHLHFSADGVFGRTGTAKLLTLGGRFVVGITGTTLLFTVFDRLKPVPESSYYFLFFFISIVIPGFWVYSGAPWLFQRLHLAERGEDGETRQAE
jgi:hypothetical protein